MKFFICLVWLLLFRELCVEFGGLVYDTEALTEVVGVVVVRVESFLFFFFMVFRIFYKVVGDDCILLSLGIFF